MLFDAANLEETLRIYLTYGSDGNHAGWTTVVVAGLPSADFLLEIECEAVLE
jgi:enamine deaminase RidA (YjgF/YER057c/UK114 family)